MIFFKLLKDDFLEVYKFINYEYFFENIFRLSIFKNIY